MLFSIFHFCISIIHIFLRKEQTTLTKKDKESYGQKLTISLAPTIFSSMTLFAIAYMNLLASDKAPSIKLKGFSISNDLQFAIMIGVITLLLYLTFNSIRKAIIKYNDSLQEPFSGFIGYSRGSHKNECIIDDFLFENEFSIRPELYINHVDGPFCTGRNEERCGTKLVVKKTLFGNYKYTCELCGKTRKIKLSSWSLQKRTERIILAKLKQEKHSDHVGQHDDFRRY